MDDISVVQVAPSPPRAEELDSLGVQILDGLARHDDLSRQCAVSFLDCSEVAVRTGWALHDAHQLVKDSGGSWQSWLTARGISIDRATRLKRLSNFFARDLTDFTRRKEAGYGFKGLQCGIGQNLREQLIATKVQSQNQLLRLLGLKSESVTQKSGQIKKARSLPATPLLPERAQRNGDHDVVTVLPEARSVEMTVLPAPRLDPIDAVVAALKSALLALDQVDFDRTSFKERQRVLLHLGPLGRYIGRIG